MKQLPEAFEERMKELLKEEYGAFAAACRQERSQGLRLNPLKKVSKEQLESAGFHLNKIPWVKEGYYYGREDRPGKHSYHEAGMYYIQEPSAMAVGELAEVCPGEKVLDLCGAPGGKSTHIAGKMQGQGFLVSNEIHPARVKILSQNIERMGIANAVVTNEDASSLAARFPAFFDRIIVDAPCSGEGMFRKDEDAREQWSPEHVTICAARQSEILDCASTMVRSGGRIVYSTCTFAPEENEQTILRFLERHPDFSVIRPEGAWEGLSAGRPEWAGEEARTKGKNLEKTFRIWPHKAEGEGHFIAVLEKKGNPENRQPMDEGKKEKKIRSRKKAEAIDKDVWKNLEDFCRDTLTPAAAQKLLERKKEEFLLFGEQLYLLPPGFYEAAGERGLDGLKVLRPGLHLGTCKKQRFEPSHAWALHLQPEEVLRELPLSPEKKEGAPAYLTGNIPQGTVLEKAGKGKGWVLITVEGCSLGWGKLAGGTVKNHYPKGLRWPSI